MNTPTPPLHIALYQPEIPPNTGNIIRLSANLGASLHLIHPLGFDLSDRHLRRAGLDYHELTHLHHHSSFSDLQHALSNPRIFACTTRASRCYSEVHYQPGDLLLFGPETRGLPEELLAELPPAQRLRIPMRPGNRSLNLSNAVAVIAYEAWRQMGFCGGG